MIEAPRQPLDDEIDRVAATLVALPDDDRLLQRVMARLPERAASPWFMAMPVQAAAGAALVLMAFLYARSPQEHAPFDSQPQSQLRPLAQGKPTPEHRAAIVRATGMRSPIPNSRSPISEDHERSLAPVDVIEGLELSTIGAPALEVAAADLEPLVLTELVLASEPSSPHER